MAGGKKKNKKKQGGKKGHKNNSASHASSTQMAAQESIPAPIPISPEVLAQVPVHRPTELPSMRSEHALPSAEHQQKAAPERALPKTEEEEKDATHARDMPAADEEQKFILAKSDSLIAHDRRIPSKIEMKHGIERLVSIANLIESLAENMSDKHVYTVHKDALHWWYRISRLIEHEQLQEHDAEIEHEPDSTSGMYTLAVQWAFVYAQEHDTEVQLNRNEMQQLAAVTQKEIARNIACSSVLVNGIEEPRLHLMRKSEEVKAGLSPTSYRVTEQMLAYQFADKLVDSKLSSLEKYILWLMPLDNKPPPLSAAVWSGMASTFLDQYRNDFPLFRRAEDFRKIMLTELHVKSSSVEADYVLILKHVKTGGREYKEKNKILKDVVKEEREAAEQILDKQITRFPHLQSEFDQCSTHKMKSAIITKGIDELLRNEKGRSKANADHDASEKKKDKDLKDALQRLKDSDGYLQTRLAKNDEKTSELETEIETLKKEMNRLRKFEDENALLKKRFGM